MNNSENKYQYFTIQRQSGTYADALEAFGLASLLEKINNQLGNGNAKITIENKGTAYVVSNSHAINIEQVNGLKYFQVVKFVKNKIETEVPTFAQADFFDYPTQKGIKDLYKEEELNIRKEKNKEIMKEQLKALNERKKNEFGKRIDAEYDIYSQIIRNPYSAFCKLYENFNQNQSNFNVLVFEIFNFYSGKELVKKTFKITEKVTSQQLFAPNQGKGLNRNKADKADMENLDGYWVTETMKIAGAFEIMFCQNVKVGSTYDMKVFVPDFNFITLKVAKSLQLEFKRNLKSVSPVKLDILNVLNYAQNFIKLSEEYKGKIKDTIGGFYSVYQKDLGQNKAVANISYLEVPNFIEFETKKEGVIWLEILKEQSKIINGIAEQGDAIQGLLAYRNFISSSNLDSFFKFNNWYSIYLMQALSQEKYFIKPFSIETLNKFFNMVEYNDTFKLSEIITDTGFLAVAKTIRKSTVSLQYTPKNARKYEIRYGVAQQLQNKSRTKIDFVSFIGEFIGIYNAETARQKEKNPDMPTRAIVKDEELNAFYALLDKYPAKLIGSLLASYGFALNAKSVKDEGDDDHEHEEEK